jgi:hypothetical protein
MKTKNYPVEVGPNVQTAARIAVACAEHVLPRFEKRRPNDKRPRKAIEAARAWLQNPCEETQTKAAYASSASSAAAARAYASSASASSAAEAACYAAEAACCADYAAASADYATKAADAAANAASDCEAERKWQAEMIREMALKDSIPKIQSDARYAAMTEAANIADTIRNAPFKFANDHSVSVNILHARDRKP